tara:strand:- start:2887 stop:3717 length:831 start_codon:yes stop_codon:yes gene_type:complete
MKVSVSTKWLNENLNNKDLIIIDFSWYLPSEKRDCYKEFLNGHIPGSIYLDMDNISDTNSKLPHMLPDSEKFENFMKLIGLNNNSLVVVYDSKGIYSSPRLWWMMKYFGLEKVYILNGGLKKWIKERRIITKKIKKRKYGNFKSSINVEYLSKIKNIYNNLNNKNIKILDARNKNRFNGLEIEPRKNLRKGHIPNSINLTWSEVLNKNGTLKKDLELLNIFNKLKINKKNKIICTCGSGVTACILNISLVKIDYLKISVYDGSWSEWGSLKKMPIS